MTPFEGAVYLRRRRWWALLLPLGGIVGLGLALQSAHARSHLGLLSGGYFLIVTVAVTVAAGRLFANRVKAKQSKLLRVDDKGVSLDGVLTLSRKRLLGGAHLRPHKTGELSVRIPATLPLRSVEIDVANEVEGLAVLQALGQDPAHAAVRFRLASGFENPVLRKIATFFLATLGMIYSVPNAHGSIFNAIGLLWMTAIAVSGLSFLLPTHVTVGSDGVFVQKRGRKSFIPFSEITNVENHPLYSDAIVLALKGGGEVTLRTSVQDRKDSDTAISDDARAVRARLESALKSFRESTREANALLQLKRGGRSAKEWIESLEALRKERGYREMRVSDEELWRVLEDPSAPAEDRAAALVALRTSLDDRGKERQRVAVDACAEPRLRVVYEAAISDEDHDLEAALEEMRETS